MPFLDCIACWNQNVQRPTKKTKMEAMQGRKIAGKGEQTLEAII